MVGTYQLFITLGIFVVRIPKGRSHPVLCLQTFTDLRVAGLLHQFRD